MIELTEQKEIKRTLKDVDALIKSNRHKALRLCGKIVPCDDSTTFNSYESGLWIQQAFRNPNPRFKANPSRCRGLEKEEIISAFASRSWLTPIFQNFSTGLAVGEKT